MEQKNKMEKAKEEKAWQKERQEIRTGVLCIATLILGGSLYAFYKTMSGIENGIGLAWLIGSALMGMLCCEITQYIKQHERMKILTVVFPWILVLSVTGFHGYFAGMKAWMNGMIYRWNQIHDGGAALFSGNMTARDVWAFGLLAALVLGQLSWILAAKGRSVIVGIWALLWIVLMILSGTFSTVACSLSFCGLLGIYMAGREKRLNRSGIWWLGMLTTISIAGAMLIPAENMDSIEQFREQAKQKVHDLRFGEEKLPEGDLRQADTFQKDQQKVLRVTSTQEKNLYLKAFVGGVYKDSEWKEMPDSEYGGTDAGMLQWLKKKNFDPLTQSADYYRIGKEKDIEANKVEIEVNGASREYFYTTGSLKKVLQGKSREKQDYKMLTTGLTGERQYTFTEMSGSRPSELTVADSWIQNPETKKQKEYKEAEAVYRKFVYEHYTSVDKKMYQLVDDIFWKDYDSESDGIYSALTQIRSKLKEEYTYTRTPDITESGDLLRWFLEESHSGNAMLYASAAVEAFRVHGIPARYVEGYYVSSADIASSKDGHALLSGEDAHAWVEVYFDGIGWLPVDVTPGYYYDVAALQKMVNTPDQVQKNAALKNNSFGGRQASNLEGTKEKVKKEIKKQVKNILGLILGITAVLVILITVGIMVLEAGELMISWHIRNQYRKAESEKRVRILEQELFLILNCMGIAASLGWNTKETDEILSGRMQEIRPGEYARVCELLEKQIYGEITLEKFEERTLERFVGNVLLGSRTCNWKIRWKIHQRHFGFAIRRR